MYIYTEEYKKFHIKEIMNKKFMTEAEFRFLKSMNERYPELFQDFKFVKRKEPKEACGV